ncbi:pilus assembly protein TadG-related protein [Thermoactinospora rubra]|uniref:pilus assembly protein TadG-related protein n=1 Tax=Thermoactinospora rubra TaxID=1088767 RepID=UPI001F0A8909|nr:pilus assembly protein TadG-related protein [Thermoactinospora rubra]
MSERGSMSVFTVLFSVVVFLLAGLLVDGGAAINARLRASDVAEQAARAAADRIDVEHLRATGQARLLGEDEACARAWEVMDTYGHAEAGPAGEVEGGTCEVGAGGAEVTVTVRVRWTAFFLGAVGFPGSWMEGRATAGPDAR